MTCLIAVPQVCLRLYGFNTKLPFELVHASGFPNCDRNTKWCPQNEVINLTLFINHVPIDPKY